MFVVSKQKYFVTIRERFGATFNSIRCFEWKTGFGVVCEVLPQCKWKSDKKNMRKIDGK